MELGSLVSVDTTGLQVYGKDEWHQEKLDVAARRKWRKLHLALDEHHQIIACELTTPEVGDSTAVPDPLTQMLTPFETFMERALSGCGRLHDEETQIALSRRPFLNPGNAEFPIYLLCQSDTLT